MPFLALAGPAIAGALGTSAAVGTAIGAGVGAAGSMVMANQANKQAQGAANQAVQSSQVNIDQLNEQTKAIAKQNAVDSAALEQQMTPEVPILRSEANNAILAGLRNPSLNLAQATLSAGLGDNVQTPLLQAAIAKAKENLALGGRLSTDTQNAVTNRGLATAGSVGQGGNLGLGRDIVARDLGLTSLDLENQRLNQASQLGGQEASQANFNASNFLNKLQMMQSLNNQQFGQAMQAGQYGQSIQQPLVGLDPSSTANIAMGNAGNLSRAYSNQANIAGSQSQGWQNMLGQGLGYGMQGLMGYNQQATPQTANPYTSNASFAYGTMPGAYK